MMPRMSGHGNELTKMLLQAPETSPETLWIQWSTPRHYKFVRIKTAFRRPKLTHHRGDKISKHRTINCVPCVDDSAFVVSSIKDNI